MQKIIIIAILAAVAVSTAVNIDKGTGTTATKVPVTVTLGGYYVKHGVFQKCHIMCKTCNGPLVNNCLTCHDSSTFDLASGACSCKSTHPRLTVVSAVPQCVVGTTAVAQTDCDKINMVVVTNSCTTHCNLGIKTCTAAATAVTCWASVTKSGTNTCVYLDTAYSVPDLDITYDKTDVINGYGTLTASTLFKACNPGCLTCDHNATPAVLCATCATGFTPKGTDKTECECNLTGNFYTEAGAAAAAAAGSAADTCTACGTGCTTCSSATVCTVCDSSHQLGSTTDSSSTCESIATTTTTSTTTSTTDGEKDGETTSATATDATSTNGVLLTAASMLLAVILA